MGGGFINERLLLMTIIMMKKRKIGPSNHSISIVSSSTQTAYAIKESTLFCVLLSYRNGMRGPLDEGAHTSHK